MADHTAIEWTDATWNPITGCSVVSAGCKHCYAMKLAGTRLKHERTREGLTVDTAAGPVWNGQVRLNAHMLDQPIRWRKPRKIFVCAHGDLFHESVPDDWIDAVFGVMWACLYGARGQPGHVFQVLTKRAARMREYLSTDRREAWSRYAVHYGGGVDPDGLYDQTICYEGPHPRIWLGVSVENQENYHRVHDLMETSAAVKWVSAEPLLGPLTFRPYTLLADHCFVCRTEDELGLPRGAHSHPINCKHRLLHQPTNYPPPRDAGNGIGWVVVGGESGQGARPMHPAWARALRDECAIEGTPFLFKQWGNWLPVNQASEAEIDVLYRPVPEGLPADSTRVCKVRTMAAQQAGGALSILDPNAWPHGAMLVYETGKKTAGRRLDGRLHDGYPT